MSEDSVLLYPDEETERLWEQTRARVINIELLCNDIKTKFTSSPSSTEWLEVVRRLAIISHHAETLGNLICRYAKDHGILEDGSV